MKHQKFIVKIIFAACVAFLLGVAPIAAQKKQPKTPAIKTEKRFGFLHSFKQTAGAWQAEIDYAEMFEGDAAERAAKGDKAGYSPADSSGIYVRNVNPKIHTVAVSDTAAIYLLHELEPQKIALADFAKLMRGETDGLPTFWGFPYSGTDAENKLPINVTLENGKLTKLEQVYFP